MNIEVSKDMVVKMLKLQRNAAMDDVAALTAAVEALQLENARLRGPQAVGAEPKEVPAKCQDAIMDERTS